MTGTLLSIGHGYVARALSRRLLSEGWRVIGTTRSAEKGARLAEEGVEPLIWPGETLPISEATHVLSSVSPVEGADPVVGAAATTLSSARLDWVGYLSATSVYGDHGGAWVDEDTPLTPNTGRGEERVLAEEEWRRLPVPLHIFRLSGIYGPGRSTFDKLREGRAQRIVKEGQVFSRIHVDDIVTVLAASMQRPTPGRIFNVADDDPAPPQSVIEEAARLLAIDPPKEVAFEDADLSPMARSFYADSKRVRNDRMKRELGVTLRYPTYREGLAAILKAERA